MAAFPSGLITGMQRRLQSAIAVAQSPFSLVQTVQDWGGEAWVFALDVAVKRGPQARTFEAFANAVLNKRAAFTLQSSLIGDATRTEMITVSGAGQTGNTLLTSGWGAVGLTAGQFFSLQSGIDAQLYQLTEDATPSDGAMILKFVPALRSVPEDAAAVEIASPTVALRATSDVPTDLSVGLMRFTVTAVEAI